MFGGKVGVDEAKERGTDGQGLSEGTLTKGARPAGKAGGRPGGPRKKERKNTRKETGKKEVNRPTHNCSRCSSTPMAG